MYTLVFVPTGVTEDVKVGRGVRVGGIVDVGVSGARVKVEVPVRVGVSVRVWVIVGGMGDGEAVKVGRVVRVSVAVAVGRGVLVTGGRLAVGENNWVGNGVAVGGWGEGEGVKVFVFIGLGIGVGGILSNAPEITHKGGIPLPGTIFVPSIN